MKPPRLGTGLTAALQAGYGWQDLRQDVLAGITVGIVAVPLAMALAIATGVAPQHGLYTAIFAGGLIAATGGSRFNVSGPTAAFVVILFPIVAQYGLGGLAIATMMAGIMLVVLGVTGMGALVKFVPYPVALGFTAGIAVVIATRQIPDFFGLTTPALGEHYLENLGLIAAASGSMDPIELLIGAMTLLVLLLWPRLRTPIPGPLVGLAVGAVLAWLLQGYLGGDVTVATIDSRFSWEVGDRSGTGIPPMLPGFGLPWRLPGADGGPLDVDFALMRALLGPAMAIAMLAAIESLLCAVVADGMTRTRHDPNGELIGQGLGNLAVPFFGGITATAAMARTATSVRSGARSPVAAIVHAGVVLLAVVGLAEVLGRVPMAALAALLFVVAWNMAEARHVLRTLRGAPTEDVVILLVCFALTVLFDMVLAVAVGIGLAGALFIRRMALTTSSRRLDAAGDGVIADLPAAVVVYDINGPLFFGAADRALSALRVVDPGMRVVILDMQDVPSIDGTAIAALQGLAEDLGASGIGLILLGLQPHKVVKLRRAGLRKVRGRLTYCSDIAQAKGVAQRWLANAPG